jgi:hypothetical protein
LLAASEPAARLLSLATRRSKASNCGHLPGRIQRGRTLRLAFLHGVELGVELSLVDRFRRLDANAKIDEPISFHVTVEVQRSLRSMSYRCSLAGKKPVRKEG